MKSTYKYAIVALSLLGSISAIADTMYSCPVLKGTYTMQDQAIAGSNGWFFWADQLPQIDISVSDWKTINQTPPKKLKGGFNLICHKGGKGPWYGASRFVESTTCSIVGNGQFNCK
ncbi:hypothetical protein BH10PSE19_BH10PSE19_11350 [soil metagenome]